MLVSPDVTTRVWPLLTIALPPMMLPPLLTVPVAEPPELMSSVPPLSTVVLLAMAPDATSRVTPLLMT